MRPPGQTFYSRAGSTSNPRALRCAGDLPMIALHAGLAVAGPAPAAVDFQRDVQPILREHCVGCHGPTQLYGGSGSIGAPMPCAAAREPTSVRATPAAAVCRVIGTASGSGVEPPGPLTRADRDHQTVDRRGRRLARRRLRRDAVAAGRRRRGASDDAIRDDDRRRRCESCARTRAWPSHEARAGDAADDGRLHGDAALVTRLLAPAPIPTSPTPPAPPRCWAAPDPATMRLLLDAGADANARSDESADRRSSSPAASSAPRRRSGCCSSTAPIRRPGALPRIVAAA